MTQENAYPKDNRYGEKNISQPFFIPKNQSHKKRNAGMSGKKEISAESDFIENPARFNERLGIKRAEMG